MSEREPGFYWARSGLFGWIVAEWDGVWHKWALAGTAVFEPDSTFSEIDERRIVRLPEFTAGHVRFVAGKMCQDVVEIGDKIPDDRLKMFGLLKPPDKGAMEVIEAIRKGAEGDWNLPEIEE